MNPSQVIISWEQWEEFRKLQQTPKQKECEFAKIFSGMIKKGDRNKLTVDGLIELLDTWPEY